jgi:Flp pilus assembly pilin Flp
MTGRIARVARHLWRDDRGQDLAEYGIALSVISVTVALVAIFVGLVSSGLWETAQDNIDNALGS